MEQHPDRRPTFFYGYIVVVAALCIMIMTSGAHFSFGIFFKPILTEFGWTRAIASGAFSLSMIMHGLLGVIMGGLNDRLGPRIVLMLSGVLLGLGYLLMSQISSTWQLYLFYGVIIGVGMGGWWVPLLSTIARWFIARRSLMTGVVLAGTGIGGLVAPPVANWLIYTYNWRFSYKILGILLLVVILLAACLLRRDPAQKGQMPYRGKKDMERRLDSGTKAGSGAGSGDGGISLQEAAHTRQLWMVLIGLFCFGFSFVSLTVHLAAHATDLGISAANAANILATVGGLAIVGRVLMGSMADRIGNRKALIIGFILMAASLLWLMPAREAWALYLFAAVFGFAQGGMGASESPLVARLFGLRSHGLILGFADMGFLMGGAVGPLLAGYLFDSTGSYDVSFMVCMAVSIIGLILIVLLKPVKGKHSSDRTPAII